MAISRSVRLSPNEIDELVEAERNKWRIFRLLQVREQSREEAVRIRGNVKKCYDGEVEKLRHVLLNEVQAEKSVKIAKLEAELENCFKTIGEAHRLANEQPNISEMLEKQAMKNRIKAVERGKMAMKHAQKEKDNNFQHDIAPVYRRKKVIFVEKARASKIAKLPTPQKLKKKKVAIASPKTKSVLLHEAGTFTTTAYAPKNDLVQKETDKFLQRPNAHEAAKMAALEDEALLKEQERLKEEELNQLKGKEEKRLNKERIRRQYKELLEQLEKADQEHFLSAFLHGEDLSDATTVEDNDSSQLEMKVQKLENMVKNLLISVPEKISMSEYELSSELQDDVSSESVIVSSEKGIFDLYKFMTERRERIKLNSSKFFEESVSSGSKLGDNSFKSVVIDLHPTVITEVSPTDEKQIVSGFDRHPSTDENNLDIPIKLSKTLTIDLVPIAINEESPSCKVSIVSEFSEDVSSDDFIHKDLQVPFTKENTKQIAEDAEKSRQVYEFAETVPVHKKFPPLVSRESITNKFSSDASTASDSSASVVYDPQKALENLKRLQKQRKEIDELLNKVKAQKEATPLKMTPISRIYTTELKDGSGQKPLKKKEKFERKKKDLIKLYLPRLINMEKDKMLQLSTSSVGDSGLTVDFSGIVSSQSSSHIVSSTPIISLQDNYMHKEQNFLKEIIKKDSTKNDVSLWPKSSVTEDSSPLSLTVPSSEVNSNSSSISSVTKQRLLEIVDKLETLKEKTKCTLPQHIHSTDSFSVLETFKGGSNGRFEFKKSENSGSLYPSTIHSSNDRLSTTNHTNTAALSNDKSKSLDEIFNPEPSHELARSIQKEYERQEPAGASNGKPSSSSSSTVSSLPDMTEVLKKFGIDKPKSKTA